jgi:hypothetical protein
MVDNSFKNALTNAKLALDRLGMSKFEHINTRYEYTTRELPGTTDVISAESDAEMNRVGWRRVWADVTLDGAFVVYRRERAT